MLKANLYSTAMSALLALSRAFGDFHFAPPIPSMSPNYRYRPNKARRVRIGRRYPFSSTKQNERFRRQLEAGQVKFA